MDFDLFRQTKYTPKNESVLNLINDYKQKYQPVFDRVKKYWNMQIRDFLRDSTGLRLNRNKDSKLNSYDTNITINFISDHDNEFMKLIDTQYPDLNFYEFKSLQKLQKSIIDSMQFYDKYSVHYKDLNVILLFCNEYFTKYNLDHIINDLFKKTSSKDIWGSYTFASNTISLFYLPIILFSDLKELDIEYMAAIVLAHELAHGYHHIGKDKDNRMWNSMVGGIDLNIIEGLAQYYTEAFVNDNEIQHPKLKQSYSTMLNAQSGPYRIHEKWKDFKREHVNTALISFRHTNETKYSEFEKLLKNTKELIK